MKKLIYISGPMSGLPANNVPAFNRAAKALRAKGYKVVNPAELDEGEPCSDWTSCLRRDIRELSRCTDIALLPGWTESKGASLEVHIGKELGFTIADVGYYLKRGRK
jgi:hypothetical protein